MTRRGPGGTPATVALDRAGVSYTPHSYEHDPAAEAYGLEAATALGVPAGQVFKTLVVDTGAGLAVGVVPVAARLDLKALARAVGAKKADLADPAAAERSSGMVVGGISPVGQKRLLPTVLDVSMGEWETVFVSGGRRGFDVELTPDDLARLIGATFAPIAVQAGSQ